MPGRLISVDVAKGVAVVRGQKLLTLEAMKMEHSLTAPFDGKVAELNADDWKSRDRAAAQLAALGPAAGGVLRAMRDGQPPEVRQRIDQILASFEAAGAARPARQTPPVAVDGDAVQPNPPADTDADVAPPDRG